MSNGSSRYQQRPQPKRNEEPPLGAVALGPCAGLLTVQLGGAPAQFRPRGVLSTRHPDRLRETRVNTGRARSGWISGPDGFDYRPRRAHKGRSRHPGEHESQLFDAAVDALKTRYSVHQPENWHATYASFADPHERSPEVGIQLAVAGSGVDKAMRRFPALLRRDPIMRDRYNALKQSFEGGDPVEYVTGKGAFIQECLEGADDECST